MNDHQQTTLSDIGLPVGSAHGLHDIAYNAPSRTLVAVLRSLRFVEPEDLRVFVRRVDEGAYREVVLPDELASVSDIVTCSETSEAYMNVMKWSDASRTSADFFGHFRLLLPEGVLHRLPDPFDPHDPDTSMFIWQLVGPSSDARELHVIVGRPAAVAIPPEIGYRMGYYLAALSVETGALSTIAELPAIVA